MVKLKNKFDIAVIGAGPAGLICSGTASENNKVLLLEKKNQPGIKLSITGKGRCNLTNASEIDHFLAQFFDKSGFLKRSFDKFFNKELCNFFKELNVSLKTERGKRIFPENIKAVQVRDILVKWVKSRGVRVETGCNVKKLFRENDLWVIDSLYKPRFRASKVVIATGGMSYPKTGSTGDGYVLAENLGHTIVKPVPALVPLRYKDKFFDLLDGEVFRNIRVTLIVDSEKVCSDTGEVSMYRGTVEGALPLTYSFRAVQALDQGRKVSILLDLKPGIEKDKLIKKITLLKSETSTVLKLLSKLTTRKAGTSILRKLRINQNNDSVNLGKRDVEYIANLLKNFEIKISAYASWDRAIITAGGIELSEVNPQSMESELCRDLYFAGEILNIHAGTGGYNLQAAFSTGVCAAEACLK